LLKSDVKSHLCNLKQQEFDEDVKFLCDKLCVWLRSERFDTKALFASFPHEIVQFSKNRVTKAETQNFVMKIFTTPLKSKFLESVEKLEETVSNMVFVIMVRFIDNADATDLEACSFKNQEYFRYFYEKMVIPAFFSLKGDPFGMLKMFGVGLFCCYKLGLPVLVFKAPKVESPAWADMLLLLISKDKIQLQREFLHSIARYLRQWHTFYFPQDLQFWQSLCMYLRYCATPVEINRLLNAKSSPIFCALCKLSRCLKVSSATL